MLPWLPFLVGSPIMSQTPNLLWYVVQARSGFEKPVAQALRDRIVEAGLQDRFGEVLVPSETVLEMRDGQKRKSERKFFPGYILVQIDSQLDNGIPRIDSESWHLVRETHRVMGFIGGTAERPLPITEAEADKILQRVKAEETSDTPKVLFSKGDLVRVVDGPFNDFNGVVEGVDAAKGKIDVSVLIFGRSTTVTLTIDQVERA